MAAPGVATSASRWQVAIFVAAIFASAFLIFGVQPLVGKRILPWFGGSPGVWMLCLAFYQCALFLGYAYAHALIRTASPLNQVFVHAALLCLALAFLPVLPDDSWRPTGVNTPQFHILGMLLWNVALPFGILAASSPLIQAWFARRYPERSPYPLYAVSNLGSFLALIAYPFWIEPRLPVSVTGALWSIGFIAAGVLIVTCAVLARSDATHSEAEAVPGERPTPRQISFWALLSGTAVAILMGVTNQLTLDIASVPLLWVLPLGLYLATFIAAFASERFYVRPLFVLFVGVAIVGLQFWWIFYELYQQVLLYCGLLFGCCMILHGELYRKRPAPESLTTFYLSISGGGAIAGLFVGLVAPQIFDDYHELPLGVALGWLLLLFACRGDSRSWIGTATPRWRWAFTVGATIATITAVNLIEIETLDDQEAWIATGDLLQSTTYENRRIHQERTFFGVLTVRELGPPPQRQLMHGTTMHGVQGLSSKYRRRPTSYYGARTPIGVLMRNRAKGEDTRIGIIGMGIGTLSTYGRPGDLFRFYEIDPAVVQIALDARYFDVVSGSRAEIEIVEGDGRLALESELERGGKLDFDILILDAFSSDAVPVHLLTREAFQIYRQVLAPDGIIALHISNRYINLAPPIARAASSTGMGNLFARNPDLPGYMSATSQWSFVSPDRDRIHSLAQQLEAERLREVPEGEEPMLIRSVRRERMKDIPLWTDDFVDVLSTIPVPKDLAALKAFFQRTPRFAEPGLRVQDSVEATP